MNKNIKSRLRVENRWLPVVFWACLMLVISSVPAPVLPEAGPIGTDKLIHCAEYMIFSVLLVRASNLGGGRPGKRKLLIGGIVFALLDELHQLFIPGRFFDLFDLFFDSLGIVSGQIFQVWLKSHYRGSRSWLLGLSGRSSSSCD